MPVTSVPGVALLLVMLLMLVLLLFVEFMPFMFVMIAVGSRLLRKKSVIGLLLLIPPEDP